MEPLRGYSTVDILEWTGQRAEGWLMSSLSCSHLCGQTMSTAKSPPRSCVPLLLFERLFTWCFEFNNGCIEICLGKGASSVCGVQNLSEQHCMAMPSLMARCVSSLLFLNLLGLLVPSYPQSLSPQAVMVIVFLYFPIETLGTKIFSKKTVCCHKYLQAQSHILEPCCFFLNTFCILLST